MRCARWREAISARLDGEVSAEEAAVLDTHLDRCAECRRFADDATRMARLTRIGVVDPGPDPGLDPGLDPGPDLGPDLVAAVLAAAPPSRGRWWPEAVQLGLGAVGIAQFAVAANGLAMGDVADHHGVVDLAGASATHFSHESVAWNLALAVGFLWVAVGGTREVARVVGLIPVIGAFVIGLSMLSASDAANGWVSPDRLATHLLVVVGLALLLTMRRLARRDGGGTDAAGPAEAPTAAPPAAPWSVSGPAVGAGGADDDLRPTAHRAA